MEERDWEGWMWVQARELLLRADRIQRGFLEASVAAREAGAIGPPSPVPAVNVVETEDGLTVTAALPGVEERDVDVRLSGGSLVLSAQRSLAEPGKRGVLHVLEIAPGRLERRVRLPDGAAHAIESARLERGLLTVTLRRRT